jgi:cell division protease FtsH
LEVHAAGKPLDEDINLKEIAMHTPGFSGADLANLMNEGALLAARRKQQTVTQQDLRDAMERVMAGPERKSRRIGEVERKIIAYHEAGHALVATRCKHATAVAKISIVPRGHAALGYTLHLPDEDRYLMTRSELEDQIATALGGRVAEDLIFQEISTGAQNDLEKITEMARSMVCRYGMSEKVGPVTFSQDTLGNKLYLTNDQDAQFGRSMSEVIDSEVVAIVEKQFSRVKNILEQDMDLLHNIANLLLEKEVLGKEELQAIFSCEEPRQPLNGEIEQL